MRASTARRIIESHHVTIDPNQYSLTALLDIEARLGTASRIKSNHNLEFDARQYSLSTLLDIEARLGTASRIKSNHNLEFDARQYSLSTLLDIEARLGTAKRLKTYGVDMDYRGYSLSQLLDAEARVSTAARMSSLAQAPTARVATPVAPVSQREEALKARINTVPSDSSAVPIIQAPPPLPAFVPRQSSGTYPIAESSHSDPPYAVILLIVGVIVAIIIFVSRTTPQTTDTTPGPIEATRGTPSHEPTPTHHIDATQPMPLEPSQTASAWQRALVPAFKAAKWGSLIGMMSVFRVQSDLTFGDRLFMAFIFSVAVGLLLFVPVYFIAAINYASRNTKTNTTNA